MAAPQRSGCVHAANGLGVMQRDIPAGDGEQWLECQNEGREGQRRRRRIRCGDGPLVGGCGLVELCRLEGAEQFCNRDVYGIGLQTQFLEIVGAEEKRFQFQLDTRGKGFCRFGAGRAGQDDKPVIGAQDDIVRAHPSGDELLAGIENARPDFWPAFLVPRLEQFQIDQLKLCCFEMRRALD